MNFLADDKKGKLGEIKSGIDEADVLVTFTISLLLVFIVHKRQRRVITYRFYSFFFKDPKNGP